jgi:hypothetical protein
MKKTLLTILFSTLFASKLFAAGVVGIKFGSGTLEGETTSDEYALQKKDKSHEYAAIFIEADTGKTIPNTDVGVSIGLEYIPYQATVSVDGNSSDSYAELNNHTTIYANFAKPLSAGKIYGKLGYSMADVTAKANYVTTTVTSYDDKLQGPTIGLGFEKDLDTRFIDVLRLEATYTKYDEVSYTSTSNSGVDTDTRKADVNLTTISLSVGKRF